MLGVNKDRGKRQKPCRVKSHFELFKIHVEDLCNYDSWKKKVDISEILCLVS